MKLVVDEVTYEVNDALQNATLGDLLVLKLKTKTADFPGVTIRHIRDSFSVAGDRFGAGGDESDIYLDLLGDEGFLNAMVGLIFLAKRVSHEEVSVEDVKGTAFSSFRFEADEAEVEAPKESAVVEGPAPE